MDSEKIRETKQRLIEINNVISMLDPAIRAAAFDILLPIYFQASPSPKVPKATSPSTGAPQDDVHASSDFYDQWATGKKPKDNVLAIVAHLYSQYGRYSITRKDIETEASNVGIIIPHRPDNTMRAVKKDGKNIFKQAGSGWQLTVIGESYIADTFEVRKGTKPRPSEEAE